MTTSKNGREGVTLLLRPECCNHLGAVRKGQDWTCDGLAFWSKELASCTLTQRRGGGGGGRKGLESQAQPLEVQNCITSKVLWASALNMIQAITESQWRERVSTRETADKAVCSVLGELSRDWRQCFGIQGNRSARNDYCYCQLIYRYYFHA